MKIPVVFRMINDELLAIFPTMTNRNDWSVECCSDKEGWCSCQDEYARKGRLATPEEYIPFLKWLNSGKDNTDFVVHKRLVFQWN